MVKNTMYCITAMQRNNIFESPQYIYILNLHRDITSHLHEFTRYKAGFLCKHVSMVYVLNYMLGLTINVTNTAPNLRLLLTSISLRHAVVAVVNNPSRIKRPNFSLNFLMTCHIIYEN